MASTGTLSPQQERTVRKKLRKDGYLSDGQQAATPAQDSTIIQLPALNIKFAEITLIGDSPLIVHAWSEKAKREMLEKQQKKAKQAKEARDPNAEYEASLYRLDGGGYGFPSVAFKSAAVDACSHVSNVTKVQTRGAFHIIGDMVKIIGEPRMREDMVRLGGIGQSADLRYRGEFTPWRVTFTVRYNVNVMALEQVMNLFNTAGFAIGVGEWRPQKDGSFGMFHVASNNE